jgi:hypothetical protein
MGRAAWTVVGTVVGGYFGYPQLGAVVGGIVGGIVEGPERIQGPRIGEVQAQTSAEGAPRTIVFGTYPCVGNVIVSGQLIKQEVEEEGEGKGGGPVTSTEHAYRTYAIRVCEGPIGGILRIWEDEKLVYDVRHGSLMLLESFRWIFGINIYLGTEDQLPDVFLQILCTPPGELHPAYRGTAYLVFVGRDLTDRRGSIPQYRFEVAREVESSIAGALTVGPENNEGFQTHLGVDSGGRPYQLMNQTGGTGPFGVGFPGGYDVLKYDPDDFATQIVGENFINAGDTLGDTRLWPIAVDDLGYAVSFDANFGYCKLIVNGEEKAYYKPSAGASPSWWFNEAGYAPEYGGLVWFWGDAVFLGVRITGSTGTPWDSIYKFPRSEATGDTYPIAQVNNITGLPAPVFWMNVSRLGRVYVIAINGGGDMKGYTENLVHDETEAIPASMAAILGDATFFGFGVDEAKGLKVFVYGSPVRAEVFDMANTSLATILLPDASIATGATRVMFSSEWLWIQRHAKTYRIDTNPTLSGQPMTLGDIVAEIHDRCDVPPTMFDVSELDDPVAGLGLSGDYTGASAVDVTRSAYFFDKSEHDKKLWYPKRGAAVVDTLTIDDLVEEPDMSKRQQASEYPRKLHLFYQHANSGYARVKATSARSSPDIRVTGEQSVEVPVVLNEDQAAQTAAKVHKVTWTEADGEIEVSVPESFLAYIPSDCVGLSLRGQVNRLRIDSAEHADGVIKWKLRHDRQSAYTSNLTGVPIPAPTLPPPTIVGDTAFAFLDIGSRVDTEDDLHYLVAGSGGMPAWYGWTLQRSLDGGANYSTVQTFNSASVMGSLLDPVADASDYYTDTTNVVRVQLTKASQVIEDITEAQFLSEGGAFALEKEDGSYEVMQYRDAVDEGDGVFALSILHRGQLNSGAAAHTAGAVFVMLARTWHIPAQSAWIGQSLTHRPVSFDQSPEEAAAQTDVYVGRSQREWPVAYLTLARDGSDVVTASWTPRHRFGTEDAPVASINFQGYRVTLDDGVLPAVTFDTATAGFTYDASALGSPLTVSVSALNRITGAGPATSGAI